MQELPETLSKSTESSQLFNLSPIDNDRLANLCGLYNEHIQQLEKEFDVSINQRGHQFEIVGLPKAIKRCEQILNKLYEATDNHKPLTPNEVHLVLKDNLIQHHNTRTVKTSNCTVTARGKNQQHYLKCILEHNITFGIGPAGTGKTFLAIACAAEALEKELVERIILVRPAVEAGERLGFLPGDLTQKVDPYLRPLYDGLYEMFDQEKVLKLIQSNRIEIAPLAYMRGRTLNDSYIILDEAQNTTQEQMKMFLTRIGFGSTAVITGDVTQIDLPNHNQSGLIQAMKILDSVKGIHFCKFEASDVVRHPLVQHIVEAYDRHQQTHHSSGKPSGKQ